MLCLTSPISRPQLYLPAAGKPRLLIVSDSSERLTELRASLGVAEIEITGATSAEELSRACRCGHDLAAIDVGPAHLAGVLKALRASAGHAEIPLLVEASRLSAETGLAGLLPKYRAMPCSRADLLTLVRRRTTSAARHGKAKRML